MCIFRRMHACIKSFKIFAIYLKYIDVMFFIGIFKNNIFY